MVGNPGRAVSVVRHSFPGSAAGSPFLGGCDFVAPDDPTAPWRPVRHAARGRGLRAMPAAGPPARMQSSRPARQALPCLSPRKPETAGLSRRFACSAPSRWSGGGACHLPPSPPADSQADHDLRQVITAVLGLAVRPEPGSLARVGVLTVSSLLAT